MLIFTVIAAALYSTFSTGTSVWKRTKGASHGFMKVSSALDGLAKDLHNSVKYEVEGMKFNGTGSNLEFCYLANTAGEEQSVIEVYRTYYYTALGDVLDGSGGKYALFKKTAPLNRGGFAIDEETGRQLVGALEGFNLEYALKDASGEIIWESEWKEDKEDLPKAVKVAITTGGVKYTKYIDIPIGKLIEAGTD